MEDLIRFYLLERPRNVSDMIRDLTVKSLSESADKRRQEIPRIAGNWFREDTGYIWRLKERGHIKDSGKRYIINTEGLIEDLFADMELEKSFKEYDARGEDAMLKDPYRELMGDKTFHELKNSIKEAVFSGEKMARVFNFKKWKEFLTKETGSSTIFKYNLILGFKSSIHFVFISSILKSRKSMIEDKIEGGESYFTWKNRLDRFKKNEEVLKRKIIKNIFPYTGTDSNGKPADKEAKKVFDAFDKAGESLDKDTLETLANMYLLFFKDGVELFDQYSKYDHDINLFFNLLERGWMIDSRNVDRDSRTGNFVVPLSNMRSYLDTITELFNRKV